MNSNPRKSLGLKRRLLASGFLSHDNAYISPVKDSTTNAVIAPFTPTNDNLANGNDENGAGCGNESCSNSSSDSCSSSSGSSSGSGGSSSTGSRSSSGSSGSTLSCSTPKRTLGMKSGRPPLHNVCSTINDSLTGKPEINGHASVPLIFPDFQLSVGEKTRSRAKANGSCVTGGSATTVSTTSSIMGNSTGRLSKPPLVGKVGLKKRNPPPLALRPVLTFPAISSLDSISSTAASTVLTSPSSSSSSPASSSSSSSSSSPSSLSSSSTIPTSLTVSSDSPSSSIPSSPRPTAKRKRMSQLAKASQSPSSSPLPVSSSHILLAPSLTRNTSKRKHSHKKKKNRSESSQETTTEPETSDFGSQNTPSQNTPSRSQYSVTRLRAVKSKRDPLDLIACDYYEGKQPCSLKISSQVMLILNLHSHLADTEIIGLLGGQFDEKKKELSVQVAYSCECLDTDNNFVNVEMDPASQVKAVELIHEAKMGVVGWYHSHPHFCNFPSVTDCENQSKYQALFQDQQCPFVGAIITPYVKRHIPSETKWFECRAGEPKLLRSEMVMKLEHDTCKRARDLAQHSSKLSNCVDFSTPWEYDETTEEEPQSCTKLVKLRSCLVDCLPPSTEEQHNKLTELILGPLM